MVNYVVVLEPEEKLIRQVLELKRLVFSKVGDQLYLQDPPHITLYVAGLEDRSTWLMPLRQTIKRTDPDLSFGITGWKTFPSDAITGNHTLACEIGEGDVRALKAVQRATISLLGNYWTKKPVRRYEKAYPRLSQAEKDNVESTGYPFSGDIWIPHITIASFKKPDYDAVTGDLTDMCPRGRYRIKSVGVYRLNDDESITLEEEFPLE